MTDFILEPLENEPELIGTMFDALAGGTLPGDAWDQLATAAQNHNRLTEVVEAFASVAQDRRRLSGADKPALAEFFYQAAYFASVLGDFIAADGYLERCLRDEPSHPKARKLAIELLESGVSLGRRVEIVVIDSFRKDPDPDLALVHRLAAVLVQNPSTQKQALALLEDSQKKQPSPDTLRALADAYGQAGRLPEVARTLESLLSDLAEDDTAGKTALREQLLELYTGRMKSAERALPFAEALLEDDSTHDAARNLCTALLQNKGVQARAALALAHASRDFAFEEVRYLELALESTRGAGRRDILKRLGSLRLNPISDQRGAFEAFEGALMLDPSDDEVREHHRNLALSLGSAADAARTLIRVAPSIKDPVARARIAVDTGELLEVAGDRKRAKTTLQSALTSQGALPETQLLAARALAAIYESEEDDKHLIELLEQLAQLETDPERRHQVLLRTGELGERAGDADKAIAAFVQLATVPEHRPTALAHLEQLYTNTERWRDLASVLQERAQDTADTSTRRQLLFRSAELYGGRVHDPKTAKTAWEALLEEFGPSRDLFAEFAAVLEQLREHERLDEILLAELKLADPSEHAMLLARLAAFRVRKVKDLRGGFDSLKRALTLDASEPQALELAEGLLTEASLRGEVAGVLAPIYRAEGKTAELLKVTEIIGRESEQRPERLAAWSEAAQLALGLRADNASDFAARAVSEADGDELTERIPLLLQSLDELGLSAARRADAWTLALGDREVDSDALFAVILHTGESLEAAGRKDRAAEVYRRGLRYAPDDRDLLTRIDGLLLSLGKPEERLLVFNESLASATDPGQRHAIYVQIARLHQDDLRDDQKALEAYEAALQLDPSDQDSLLAALALYKQLRRGDALVAMVDASLPSARAELRPALQLEAIDTLAAAGEIERAKERVARLLTDEHVEVEQIDRLFELGTGWQEPSIVTAALWKKSEKVDHEPTRAEVLLQVCGLEPDAATRRRGLERAIAAAQATGDDRLLQRALAAMADELAQVSEGAEVPPGYGDDFVLQLIDLAEARGDYDEVCQRLDTLVARTAKGEVRRTWALRLARGLEEDLGSSRRAFTALAREVAGGDVDRELLEQVSRLASESRRAEELGAIIDEQLAQRSGDDGDTVAGSPDASLLLALTKARTFARDRHHFTQASEAYETAVAIAELLGQGEVLAEYQRAVLDALAVGIDANEQYRSVQRRRVDAASADDRLALLNDWAERERDSAPEFALGLYEELLALSPDDPSAHAAVAKLALRAGALERAVTAIEAQRERTPHEQRAPLTLELAELLFSGLGDGPRALVQLRELLLLEPGHPEAFALLGRVAEIESARAELPALVEQVALRAIEHSEIQAATKLLRWALSCCQEPSLEIDRTLAKLAEALEELGLEQDELEARVLLAASRGDSHSWDRAEHLARNLHAPSEVKKAYEGIDYAAIEADDAERIGERAIAFFEEWYEDPQVLHPLLERLFAVPATSQLAFERLRLFYDTNERWPELFVLYDRAIARAQLEEREQLLEEIAHVAKDFAKDEARAAAYYEALFEIRPNSKSAESALERLYERLGEHQKLVDLLSARTARIDGEERAQNDRKIARLRIEALDDARGALPILEELSGEEVLDAELIELFVKALENAHDDDTKRGAARRLSRHHRKTGEVDALAGTLRAELGTELALDERRARYTELAETELLAERPDAALEARAQVLRLDPADIDAVEAMNQIARDHVRFAATVGIVSALADEQPKTQGGTLRLFAARLAREGAEHQSDLELQRRAIDLYRAVFDESSSPDAYRIESAQELDRLYHVTEQPQERLLVLERHAVLEREPTERARVLSEAGSLASELGENARAIAALVTRVELTPDHLPSLDQLIVLYEAEADHAHLAAILEHRADQRETELAAGDLEWAARLHDEQLDDQPKAIELLERIVATAGDGLQIAFAQANLHGKLGEFSAQQGALQRAASWADDDLTTARVLGEIGELSRTHLDDEATALDHFERALTHDPRSSVTLRGLRALLESPTARARAGALLDGAFRKVDDITGVLSVVEVRLESMTTDEESLALLLEAARLHEERQSDVSQAYRYYERALVLMPSREDVRLEALRTAERAGEFARLREAYERVVGEHDALDHEIHLELARLLERHLEDLAAALARFRFVYDHSPTTDEPAIALLRLGVPLDQHKLVANVLAAQLTREGALSETALHAVKVYLDHERVLPLALAIETVASKLDPAPSTLLLAQAARWLGEHREHDAESSRLYRRALELTPEDEGLLTELVEVERRTRGEELVDSLLQLSRVHGGDLGLLTEASEHALYTLQSAKLARSTLGLLRSLSIALWTSQAGEPDAQEVARYARAKLEELFVREQQPAERIALLAQDAGEPWEDSEKRELLMRAAALSVEELDSLEGAAAFYEQLFSRDPFDREVRLKLRDTLTRQGDRERLREFSYRELEVLSDSQERAEVRIRIAELEDDNAKAEQQLRDGISERPRDQQLLEVLDRRLDAEQRSGERFTLFMTQAEHILNLGATPSPDSTPRANHDSVLPGRRAKVSAEDAKLASDYFLRAMSIAESQMDDPRRALSASEAAIRALPEPSSMAMAAKLAASLDRHTVAAHYLSRILEVAPSVEVFLELAEVHSKTKQHERVEEVLERAIELFPESSVLRLRLCDHYRQRQNWARLAPLLQIAAERAQPIEERVQYSLESARLYTRQLGEPQRAIEILEAAELARGEETTLARGSSPRLDAGPQADERALRFAKADALASAGRTEEARELLVVELESYGGRRPKERAPVHLYLARLYRGTGDEARALKELDTATRIDPTYQPAVRLLGELAEQNAQWDQAERAYRALLSVVRRLEASPRTRSTTGAQEDDLSSTEVLLLLSRVAIAKGEEVRGHEILETAFEAAHDNPAEAERLEGRLREAGDHVHLARVLRIRANHHDADADTLRELAKLELEVLNEPERSYESAREAFRREPGRLTGDVLLEIASALGKEPELEQEFEARARALLEEGKLSPAARHASLLALMFSRRGDLDAAVGWLEKNLEASETTEDDANLLAELRQRQGDFAGVTAALELLLAQVKEPTRVNATKLRLARHLYSRELSIEEGSRYLLEAREEGVRFEDLVNVVAEAVADFPSNAHLVELYVQFARELERPDVLARALVRAWAMAKSELSFLDEAVEAARVSGEEGLEELVLRDVVETSDPDTEPAALLFGLVALATLREREQDTRAVLSLLTRASELASDDLERERLLRRLAEYARAHGDKVVAAETYAGLFEANRDDRESLTALTELYRETGQGERLAELLAELSEDTNDPSERLRLRFERLRVLEDDVGLPDAELVGPLRDIVIEAPDEQEAAERLLAILERQGPQGDLENTLDFLFESALDRGIHDCLATYALRLSGLHQQASQPAQARTVIEKALAVLPQNVELLRTMAVLLRELRDNEALEPVLDELVSSEDPVRGAALSVEISDLALERGDIATSTAALERALRLDPSNAEALHQLELSYRETSNPAKLAVFLAETAMARPTTRERAASYRRAAALYLDELNNPARAAELLLVAEAEGDTDPELVFDVAKAKLMAGDAEGAAHLLQERVEETEDEPLKARLLTELAHVLAEFDPVRAASTMGAAAQLSGRGPVADNYLGFVQGLLDGPLMSQQRTDLTFNLARAYASRGEYARARELVDVELAENPENVPGLLTLGEFEEHDGRLEEALATYYRALQLAHGEFSIELPLRVANLAEQLDRLEEARVALERIRLSLPDDRESRTRLLAIYESAAMARQVAEICQELAALEEDEARRFDLLLRAGSSFLESGEDFDLAIEPLRDAHAIRPGDLDSVALLSDAYTSVGRIDEAGQLLEGVLESLKNRRSREIGTLHHRVARVAQARGDRDSELRSLTTALEMDPQNGIAALELSQLAIAAGDLELASRGLRALTMLRGEGPVPRAYAYKQLGEIAWAQGDPKRAVLMLKRALDDDPSFEEARTLLAQIEQR